MEPACGFCEQIAPELGRLQPALASRGVELALLAHGSEETNRPLADANGLARTVLIEGDELGPEAFVGWGTPVAYLVDDSGRVAGNIAVGTEEVLALARQCSASAAVLNPGLPGSRPLTESLIEREGLRPGAPAPEFRLPDVHGGTVSLSDYRGRRLLLIFSDPHCGPCDQLASDLGRLHADHNGNGVALLMVGRGDVKENRRKARQYGLDFPVAVQQRWEISKEYGIFATPVAFLIGEDGVIKAGVARGAEQILTLARSGLEKEAGSGRAV